MSKPEPRRLSEHDVKEVVQFQECLADMRELKPREFVRKYQDYLGLNDAEAEAYIKRMES